MDQIRKPLYYWVLFRDNDRVNIPKPNLNHKPKQCCGAVWSTPMIMDGGDAP